MPRSGSSGLAADFGGGDVIAVHSGTICYRIIDALRQDGLAMTR